MATPDMDVIKEIPGYKVILKAILKSQIQQLVQQLASCTEEESVILTANVSDGTLCHLGSDSGKSFLEEKDDFKAQFLGFCLQRHNKKKQEEAREKERQEQAQLFSSQMSPRFSGPGQVYMPGMSPGISPSMHMPQRRSRPYPVSRPMRRPNPRPVLSNVMRPHTSTAPEPGIKMEPDDNDTNLSGSSQPTSPGSQSGSVDNTANNSAQLSLDSDLSGLMDSTQSDSNQTATAEQTPGPSSETGVKVENISESEFELEITGVELGSKPSGADSEGSGDSWRSPPGNMGGATGVSGDLQGSQSQQEYRKPVRTVIVVPDKEIEVGQNKQNADKPKEKDKPKPNADKPKEMGKTKQNADKPKEISRNKQNADKPKEMGKTKLNADKPKEISQNKQNADKPTEKGHIKQYLGASIIMPDQSTERPSRFVYAFPKKKVVFKLTTRDAKKAGKFKDTSSQSPQRQSLRNKKKKLKHLPAKSTSSKPDPLHMKRSARKSTVASTKMIMLRSTRGKSKVSSVKSSGRPKAKVARSKAAAAVSVASKSPAKASKSPAKAAFKSPAKASKSLVKAFKSATHSPLATDASQSSTESKPQAPKELSPVDNSRSTTVLKVSSSTSLAEDPSSSTPTKPLIVLPCLNISTAVVGNTSRYTFTPRNEEDSQDKSQYVGGYKCGSCTADFNSLKELEIHQTCHNPRFVRKKKPFECIDCGADFKHLKNLKGHMKYVHNKTLFL